MAFIRANSGSSGGTSISSITRVGSSTQTGTATLTINNAIIGDIYVAYGTQGISQPTLSIGSGATLLAEGADTIGYIIFFTPTSTSFTINRLNSNAGSNSGLYIYHIDK